MTAPPILLLALEAVADHAKATPGPWPSDGLLICDGRYALPAGYSGDRAFPDAEWVANARLREPKLAKAIIDLLRTPTSPSFQIEGGGKQRSLRLEIKGIEYEMSFDEALSLAATLWRAVITPS